MKLQEMREQTINELMNEVSSLNKKLFELRLAKSLQKLEDTSEISKARIQIAQLKTIIREKQLSK